MRTIYSIFSGLIIALIAILTLTYLIPPIDEFSLDNQFWNGMSRFKLETNATEVSNLSALMYKVKDPSKSVLFIVGPSKPFLKSEVREVKRFLKDGGTLVVADDFGSGNDLLSKLGLSTRFENTIHDPLFKYKNSKLPRLLSFTSSTYTKNLSAITFNYGAILKNLDHNAKVLAYSTSFSYIYEDKENSESKIKYGPFPVIAKVSFGKGTIILLADSSIFINSMISLNDNLLFLTNIVKEKLTYIDTSHWIPSSLTSFKLALAKLYNTAKIYELKYMVLAIVLVLAFKLRVKRKEEKRDELKEILNEYPELDRNILKRIKEMRDEFGEY